MRMHNLYLYNSISYVPNYAYKVSYAVLYSLHVQVKENSSMRLCASWDSGKITWPRLWLHGKCAVSIIIAIPLDVSRSWSLENCEEVTSTTVKETLKGSTDMEKDKPAAQTESPTFEFKRFAHFGLLFVCSLATS